MPGGPIFRDRYEDHGAISLEDGQRPDLVNSIAIAKDGAVYALTAFQRKGRSVTDLIRIRAK